jgi:hypothetical protein
MNFCALVPEISGPKNVPSKKSDAELGKIEPTPGGWNQMPAKNKEREACLNPQTPPPPDRKRPQQAETKSESPKARNSDCQNYTWD